MVKASSIITYLTISILLLILLNSNIPNNSGHRRLKNRRLRLKLRPPNATVSAGGAATSEDRQRSTFDPIVADIERKQFDHQYYNHSMQEWEEYMKEDEDYLNDEERFNVTDRLVVLFPKIDVNPVDGYVSEDELIEWNLKQSLRDVMHRTGKEMEVHDKDKDGYVSLEEYEPPSWVKNADITSFGYDMGWWKDEHFHAADADGNGRLNITEFNDFLHPADTNNPKLLLWLCKEEIRERDSDKDGKIGFKEFFHGLYGIVRNYNEEDHTSTNESHDSLEAPAQKLFNQLDQDGDGYLSDIELLPIIGKIHPTERYYAKQQTDYVMQQADKDKDRRLTLTEMIESPYVFYSAVFDEDEENDDYAFHDEFR